MSSAAPFVPKHPDSYGSHILHQLAEQRKNSELTDFILSSQGHELHCHRCVLAASSPYFDKMFSPGRKEVEGGKAAMDGVDFHMLEYIVDFMYGKCPSVSWDYVDNLSKACELMELIELKKQVDIYIADNRMEDISTCLENSAICSSKIAEPKAKPVIESELPSDVQDFLKLQYEEVVAYLNNNEKDFSHQDGLLYTLIGWVSANKDQRKPLMMDVLKFAKLPKCSAAAINRVTKVQSDLFTEPGVMRLIHESVMPRFEESEKKRNQSVLVLGGMAEYGYDLDCYTECWQYSTRFAIASWQSITNIPEEVVGKEASFVCIPYGFAVICGGRSGTVNAKYDLNKKIWTDLPPTPENLQDTVALYTDGKVHVLDGGSYSDSWGTDKMYTLNLHTLKWSRGPNRLEDQVHPIATSYKQSLWAVWFSACTFQLLAPGASKWVYKATLPANLQSRGARLVGYKENLFFLGGFSNVCGCYTIGTDQWTEMTSRPTVRHEYGSAFVLDEKIYLCGGGLDDVVEDDVEVITDCIEEYDPETDQWKVSTTKLPQKMILFTASCLPDAI